MFECTYCKRVLKKNYLTCPGCGASSFKKIEYKYDLVIEKPPVGGYKIDLGNYDKEKKLGKIFFWTAIGIVLVFGVVSIFPLIFSIIAKTSFGFFFSLTFIFISIIIAIPFIIVSKNIINKVNYKVEKVRKLANIGILIKNLNYEVVPTGTIVNNVPIYAIKVNYITKNGIEIPLISESKHDGQLSREDGTVDLLIDPNDNTNYYIDFEIY